MRLGLYSRKDSVMASRQDYARLLQMMLGQGGPNPYMGLNLRNNIGDALGRFQAKYFPNQYNNMMYYIPDEYSEPANELARRVYYNY